MHSVAVTVLIGFALLTQASGTTLPDAMTVFVLAFAVASIGLPHGALDHLVGRQLMKSLPSWFAYCAFFSAYLLVSAIVIAGWYLLPFVTLLGFFCLSAWHFGLEEDERQRLSMVQWLSMIARGGMVIWVPALFQGDEIARLIAAILPEENRLVANQIVSVLKAVSPALILLTAFDLVSYRNSKQVSRLGMTPKLQHLMRNSAFAILFATVNPLVSFGVYFCGWHSIRGLIHLRQQVNLPRKEFLLKLAPISVVSIALFAAGFFYYLNSSFVTQALLQTLFIGLSAVAIPHLLLHVVFDSLAARQDPKAGVPA